MILGFLNKYLPLLFQMTQCEGVLNPPQRIALEKEMDFRPVVIGKTGEPVNPCHIVTWTTSLHCGQVLDVTGLSTCLVPLQHCGLSGRLQSVNATSSPMQNPGLHVEYQNLRIQQKKIPSVKKCFTTPTPELNQCYSTPQPPSKGLISR